MASPADTAWRGKDGGRNRNAAFSSRTDPREVKEDGRDGGRGHVRTAVQKTASS